MAFVVYVPVDTITRKGMTLSDGALFKFERSVPLLRVHRMVEEIVSFWNSSDRHQTSRRREISNLLRQGLC